MTNPASQSALRIAELNRRNAEFFRSRGDMAAYREGIAYAEAWERTAAEQGR